MLLNLSQVSNPKIYFVFVRISFTLINERFAPSTTAITKTMQFFVCLKCGNSEKRNKSKKFNIGSFKTFIKDKMINWNTLLHGYTHDASFAN